MSPKRDQRTRHDSATVRRSVPVVNRRLRIRKRINRRERRGRWENSENLIGSPGGPGARCGLSSETMAAALNPELPRVRGCFPPICVSSNIGTPRVVGRSRPGLPFRTPQLIQTQPRNRRCMRGFAGRNDSDIPCRSSSRHCSRFTTVRFNVIGVHLEPQPLRRISIGC